MENEKFIGIDIAKNSFDLCMAGSDKVEHWDYADLKKCIKKLKKLQPQLIALEATGGYETRFVTAAVEAQMPVARLNPRRVRAFAVAVGQRAKTDEIDARIIAQFASQIKPEAIIEINKANLEVQELITRRAQLVKMRTAEICRQEHGVSKVVAKSIKLSIKRLDKEIDELNELISENIKSDPEMKEKAELLKTMPGIGEVSSACIVANLPEIGNLSNKQVASLTGTAPIARESGLFKGKRMTGGGRCDVRKQLYMPTLVAIQYNPVIRNFYHRLLDNGKQKMVAVVACMRKLITILNTMVAKNECWKF
jgi:transposase